MRLFEATTLSSRRIRIIGRVLALALFLAQLAVEAHAYSHLTNPARAPNSIDTCARCLSSTPLTAAVGSAPHIISVLPSIAERIVPVRAAPAPTADPYPAFRARAPPALL